MQRIRQYAAVTLVTFGSAMFWGALVGGLGSYILGLGPDVAFVLCCAFAALIFVIMFPRMWKPFGYRRPGHPT